MVKVALDIGHGSNTFPPSKGVYVNNKGYAEHDFNSKLVIATEKLLKQSGIDVLVYQKPYARDIGLTQRTNYYNSQKVALVYSIHANYNANREVNGRCVFYWHTSKESKRLADTVVSEIKKAGYSTHGNGLHASERGSWTNLAITRQTNMPSVLVENGFMSGSKDFDLVFGNKQSQYIKNMAEVHAKAICRFLGITYKGKGGSISVKPSKPSISKPSVNKPTPKPSVNSGGSIVDYLNSNKINSSYINRKKLAIKYGIPGYRGTASQNNKLINKMKKGVAIKPVINKRNSKTGNIQSKLNNYRVNNIKVDGLNGPSTHKALVKAYQYELNRQFGAGLVVDGIPGSKTDNASVTIKFSKSYGNLAYLTQSFLYFKGMNITPDGYWQNKSIVATKKYQKSVGLKDDGLPGKKTFKKLIRK